MENLTTHKKRTPSGKWGGVIIIAIGCLILLNNLDVNLPNWIFEWHTVLLAIGLIIGFKRNFQGLGWLILTVIGGVFTLEEIMNFNLNVSRLIWPALLIGLGAYLIFRPKCSTKAVAAADTPTDYAALPASEPKKGSKDFLDSVNVFGGSHQKVFSKNFMGGEVVAVFGGCDVDLSQADFSHEIIIEVIAIFGGCKIIVPPTWEIQAEVTAIFGGVDDKRTVIAPQENGHKRIILKGLAMFGGVDIRSY